MQEKTRQYLDELVERVEKERQQIYDDIFINSHPNLVQDDHERNIKELQRYRKFHEKGFDSGKMIEKLVDIDMAIADLKHIIYYNFDFKKQ